MQYQFTKTIGADTHRGEVVIFEGGDVIDAEEVLPCNLECLLRTKAIKPYDESEDAQEAAIEADGEDAEAEESEKAAKPKKAPAKRAGKKKSDKPPENEGPSDEESPEEKPPPDPD